MDKALKSIRGADHLIKGKDCICKAKDQLKFTIKQHSVCQENSKSNSHTSSSTTLFQKPATILISLTSQSARLSRTLSMGIIRPYSHMGSQELESLTPCLENSRAKYVKMTNWVWFPCLLNIFWIDYLKIHKPISRWVT